MIGYVPRTLSIPSVMINGGIGNAINGVCSALATGLPIFWNTQFRIYPEDLFENHAELKYTRSPGGPFVWLFPGVDPFALGRQDHYPQHEGLTAEERLSGHWKGKILPVVYPHFLDQLKLKRGGRKFGTFTVGVHVRARHPAIKDVNVGEVVKKINKLTENSAVFVSSDTELKGLSKQVIQNEGPRPNGSFRYDRDIMKFSLEDFWTLGNCHTLYRNSPISTFIDPWIFVHGIPCRRLLPVHEK